MENVYRDIDEFLMSFDLFKNLCREARKDEDYNCLYINRSKKKNAVEYIVCKATNPKKIMECLPETTLSET